MNSETIARLYIEHLIKPLETIIKSPKFDQDFSPEEQQEINRFLLKQYRNLEALIKESQLNF